jgi:hypothetical protein
MAVVATTTAREHLPDAAKSWGVKGVAGLGPVRSVAASGDLSVRRSGVARPRDERRGHRLVADFNRDWPDVSRSRETMVLAEAFGSRGIARLASKGRPIMLNLKAQFSAHSGRLQHIPAGWCKITSQPCFS